MNEEDGHDYYKNIISLFPDDGEARHVLKQLCNNIEYFLECTTDLQKYAILSFYRKYFDLSIEKIEQEANEILKFQMQSLDELREQTLREENDDE